MQNYFPYGAAPGANHPSDPPNTNNNELSDTNPAAASQYYPPMLMQQLLQQQQQATASMAEQRLSLGSTTSTTSAPADPYSAYTSSATTGAPDADYMERLQMLHRMQQQQQMMMMMNFAPPSQYDNSFNNNNMMSSYPAPEAPGMLMMPQQHHYPMPVDGKKKHAKKKHKDKPKRPLSAYNLFFKEERQRILNEISNKEENFKDDEKVAKNEEEEEVQSKGKKRTPHGKIGFESLAKTIGKRWSTLEEPKVAYYKELAAQDMVRYKSQMEGFLFKLENEKREKMGLAPLPEEKDQAEPPAKKQKVQEEETGNLEL